MGLIEWYINLLYFLNHFFCHQIPDRSIHIGGLKLPVCSRCTGIYLGMFSGYLLFPKLYGLSSRKIGFINYLIPIIPMAIDGLTQLFKLRESNNVIRFITGSLSGIAVAFILIYLILYLLDRTDIEIDMLDLNDFKNFLKCLFPAFLISISTIFIAISIQNLYIFLLLSTFLTIYVLIHNVIMPILLIVLAGKYFIREIWAMK